MPVHAVLVGKHVRSWLQFGRYVSDRENFLTMYFPGHGHYTRKFSDRCVEKQFGKNFSPRGVRPPNFLEKLKFGIKWSAPEKFHPDISKTVASSERQFSRTQKNKVADVPPKPEVRPLSAMYRWIELGAPNFSPETVPLHHFRFLNYTSKTVDFVEISDRIKT